MFNLFDNEEVNKFNWNNIGDVGIGRRILGDQMPIQMYRLFQFTIKDQLSKMYGKEATIQIFRNAGKVAGVEFANNMLDLSLSFEEFTLHLKDVLEKHKVGLLRIEKFDLDTGEATLTISEDLDCSGLPVTGETVCNYDEGFLAGILNEYTKKDYTVIERDCWANGSRVCRFDAVVKGNINE